MEGTQLSQGGAVPQYAHLSTIEEESLLASAVANNKIGHMNDQLLTGTPPNLPSESKSRISMESRFIQSESVNTIKHQGHSGDSAAKSIKTTTTITSSSQNSTSSLNGANLPYFIKNVFDSEYDENMIKKRFKLCQLSSTFSMANEYLHMHSELPRRLF